MKQEISEFKFIVNIVADDLMKILQILSYFSQWIIIHWKGGVLFLYSLIFCVLPYLMIDRTPDYPAYFFPL